MRDKKDSVQPGCDPKTAATFAASSVAAYFKKKGWKIVSFFPNSPCKTRALTQAQKLENNPDKTDIDQPD